MIINKWCIKRCDGNHEEINKWFSKKTKHYFNARSDYHPSFNQYPGFWKYLHYPAKKGKFLMKKQKGYIEITTDEFMWFIVNNNKTFIKNMWNKSENLTIIRENDTQS